MKGFGKVMAVALTALATAAVATSTVQAATAPFWSIGGVRLAAGKTHNITGRVFRRFVLSAPSVGVTLSCSNERGEHGVLQGSEPGQPGNGTGILVLSECQLETGNGAPNCKVANEIKSVPVTSKLVQNVVAGVAGKQLLTEFKPISGSRFATVRFEGSGCEITEASLTGAIAAEIVTDPAEEIIELGQTPKEAGSWLERFPATPIREISLINSGGGSKVEELELSSFSHSISITGTALGSLANSKFEPEQTKWSPLP